MSSSNAPMTVKVRCETCLGSGVTIGNQDPEGVGTICDKCDGTGFAVLTYNPFSISSIRHGIHTVRRYGWCPPESGIPYMDFVHKHIIPEPPKGLKITIEGGPATT